MPRAPRFFVSTRGCVSAARLDLQGRTTRPHHLDEALRLAKNDDERNTRSLPWCLYAFEAKADDAARYYQRAFDAQMQADNASGAAGWPLPGPRLSRIRNPSKAEQWYRTATNREEDCRPEPAQAACGDAVAQRAGRIAARRATPPPQHPCGYAKKWWDISGNENQQAFHPYLLGYIAFFSKNYKQAIDELKKGDQNDPFVLGLIAQSHEQIGEKDAAAKYYRQVLASTAHSINSAFARPLARKFLR